MIRNIFFVSLAFILLPFPAAGENNVGSCGLGSKLFQGNEGVAPQVIAAITNASGSQTFGISSGTSGCTQDGVVQSNWKTVKFMDHNLNKLARDMSAGRGETLDALASLLGVQENDRSLFFKTAQANFSIIFPAEDVKSQEVAVSLKRVMECEPALLRYAGSI